MNSALIVCATLSVVDGDTIKCDGARTCAGLAKA
ncbi:hypothetical protein ABID21_003639 [Pseudorhizobium tarimense]|uniref:Uncharacterized protein n=1 Tax=Pseudorhizobium tarimense TaxID=1079109 RepID=A0ABV2HAM2_9HYPH